MMKKLSLGVVFAAMLLVPVLVSAQDVQNVSNNNSFPNVTNNNNPPAVSPAGSATVANPLGSSSLCGLIKNILQAAIAIGIPVAVFFIVYAGFKFVMAQGSPEKLAEARQNFMWTLVGIGIFLGAWLLAQVIANTVNALQAGSGNSSVISCQ